MTPVFGHDEQVAKFVSHGLGVNINPPFVCIGLTKDGLNLQGGLVFHNCINHSGGVANIEMTVYAPGCFSRGVARMVFSYVFDQLQALRLTCRTRRRNKVVCRMLPFVGFKYEGTQENYFGPQKGDAAILYGITRAKADRWLQGKAENGRS